MTQQQRGREWQPSHAHRFADAVWEATDDELTTTEAIVLLAFANHCRKASKDEAWLAYTRLRQQCKIRSNDTVTRVLRQVVDKGWLVQVAPSRAHKQSAVYRLVIPHATAPVVGAVRTDEQGGHTETAPLNGAVVASGGGMQRSAQTAPMVDQTAPIIDGTAPLNGADRTGDRHPPAGWNPVGTLQASANTSAGALAGARPEDQKQAGKGTTGSAASQPPITAAGLAAKLGADQPLTADEAVAHMRAVLAGTRRAKTSRWPAQRDEPPNPHYDPEARLRLLADAFDEVDS